MPEFSMENISFFLGLWGSIISSILACIGIAKAFRNRFRITSSYSFTGCPRIGNEIAVYNPTDIPITINSFELHFFKKKFLWWNKTRSDKFHPEERIYNIKIPPHSQHNLTFTNGDHFDWGKEKICLILYIAGRNKPLIETVYVPNTK